MVRYFAERARGGTGLITTGLVPGGAILQKQCMLSVLAYLFSLLLVWVG